MMALLAANCRAPQPDTLSVVERIALPEASVASLHFDEDGRLWLGTPGELILADAGGAERDRIPLNDPSVPHIVAEREGRLLFRGERGATIIDYAAGDPPVQRPDMVGVLAFDVRGRVVFHSSGAGALILHDPGTLEPFRGWAAVGASTTALGLSPEGDRVYHAVGEGDEGSAPALLIRDLQTGRVLDRIGLTESLGEIFSALDGSLYAVVGRGDPSGGLLRLSWREGALSIRWRRSFSDLGIDGVSSMVLARGGDRIALLTSESEAGLLVIDAETGENRDRLSGSALAVAFDQRDRLFLLQPGELWRIE